MKSEETLMAILWKGRGREDNGYFHSLLYFSQYFIHFLLGQVLLFQLKKKNLDSVFVDGQEINPKVYWICPEREIAREYRDKLF